MAGKTLKACNSFLVELYVFNSLTQSSKRRDVNEDPHVQRKAYVNVTSPDVLQLSEPEHWLALSCTLAVNI